METVKSGTWLDDLIEIYNDLGGKAAYKDVYKQARNPEVQVGLQPPRHRLEELLKTMQRVPRTSGENQFSIASMGMGEGFGDSCRIICDR